MRREKKNTILNSELTYVVAVRGTGVSYGYISSSDCRKAMPPGARRLLSTKGQKPIGHLNEQLLLILNKLNL